MLLHPESALWAGYSLFFCGLGLGFGLFALEFGLVLFELLEHLRARVNLGSCGRVLEGFAHLPECRVNLADLLLFVDLVDQGAGNEDCHKAQP